MTKSKPYSGIERRNGSNELASGCPGVEEAKSPSILCTVREG